MNKLEKTFYSNNKLTAAELNSLTAKIDEIIDLISSIGNNSGGLTDLQVTDKINTAINQLKELLNQSIVNLQTNVENLRQVVEGASQTITAEEWAQYRKKTGDLEESVAAIKLTYDGIDLIALKDKVDNINAWAGSITVDPGKISILAALLDENNQLIINPASIIAAITDENGKLTSTIGISADNVIIDGDTTVTQGITALRGDFSNLTSGNGTFKGNVRAKEFEVIDGSDNPTIVFTTMSDAFRGAGYENLNSSSIQNGEPIGLVYDPITHKPKYFFDFAPVANSGGTTNTLRRYLLSDGGIVETSSYYYNSNPPYYFDQAGTILATSNNVTYQRLGNVNVFVRHTSSGPTAHQDVFIATAEKYAGYIYNDQGYPVYTNVLYYRVTGIDGSDYWLSLPNEKSTIINPNENIKTGFGGTSLANASAGIQFENVSDTESVSLWVFNTSPGLVNIQGKTITKWEAGQHYITTSDKLALSA